MFPGNRSSGMCVARFQQAPASTHQAISKVAHRGPALAIVAMVTMKGIIVRVEQKKRSCVIGWGEKEIFFILVNFKQTRKHITYAMSSFFGPNFLS